MEGWEWFFACWALWLVFCVSGGVRVVFPSDGKRMVPQAERCVHAHVPLSVRRRAAAGAEAVLGRGSVPTAAELPERGPEELTISQAFSHSWSEGLEVGLIGPLFLVRIVTLIMSLVVVSLCLKLSTLGLPTGEGRPAPEERAWWRRMLRDSIIPCGRVFLWALGYWWIEVHGEVAKPADAPVVVGNHVCLVEATAMEVLYQASAVSKDENFHIPLFGWALYGLECVYLSRDDPNSRHTVSKEITKRAQSGGKWPQVLLFPEGTCTNGEGVMAFQRGAFLPGVPVQAVAATFPLPRGRFAPGLLDTGPPTLEIVFRLMAQWSNSLVLDLLPPHVPSPAEKKDPALFAANVASNVAAALGRRKALLAEQGLSSWGPTLRSPTLPPHSGCLPLDLAAAPAPSVGPGAPPRSDLPATAPSAHLEAPCADGSVSRWTADAVPSSLVGIVPSRVPTNELWLPHQGSNGKLDGGPTPVSGLGFLDISLAERVRRFRPKAPHAVGSIHGFQFQTFLPNPPTSFLTRSAWAYLSLLRAQYRPSRAKRSAPPTSAPAAPVQDRFAGDDGAVGLTRETFRSGFAGSVVRLGAADRLFDLFSPDYDGWSMEVWSRGERAGPGRRAPAEGPLRATPPRLMDMREYLALTCAARGFGRGGDAEPLALCAWALAGPGGLATTSLVSLCAATDADLDREALQARLELLLPESLAAAAPALASALHTPARPVWSARDILDLLTTNEAARHLLPAVLFGSHH